MASVSTSRPTGRPAQRRRTRAAIIDALEAQDAELAHDLTAKHFVKARELRLALWAKGHE